MKPLPWVDGARAAAVAAMALAIGSPSAPSADPGVAGFGPVSLGMPRGDAIATAGPGALVGELCAGAEGVLFPAAGGEAMAMFENGRVTEMALTPPGDGAEREREDCARIALSEIATMAAQYRLTAATPVRHDVGGIVEEASRLLTAQGDFAAISRWSSRTSACWVTLHWATSDATRRIAPD